MKGFNIPGAGWVALITFVVAWLQQYVQADWVIYAVPALLAVAKGLQVFAESQEEPTVVVELDGDQPMAAGAPMRVVEVEEQPSALLRFLVG